MAEPGPHAGLNEHQRHHLLASCQYVNRQLAELEAIIGSTAGAGPFARYLRDISDDERAVVLEACAGIRAAMARVLERQHITPVESPVSSRHAIRSALNFIDIALEELQPRYMRSYGEVSADVEPELNGLVRDLQAHVQRLDAALAARAGEAPASRPSEDAAPTHVTPEAAARLEDERRKALSSLEDARVVIEALRTPQGPVVFDALEHAADRASRALDGPDPAPDVDALVREGVTAVGADRAEDVRRALANAIARGRAALQAASRLRGTPESAAPHEWARRMRVMPPFTVGALHVDARLFLRRALGASVAHVRMRKAIEAQVGAEVASALKAHAAALHVWATDVWTMVRRDVDD